MNSLKPAKKVNKFSMQKPTELAKLVSLLKTRKLKTVVEIGTAHGGTFYCWCRVAAPDAVLISIDLPGGPFSGSPTPAEMKEDFKRIKTFGKKNQTLHFIRKNSQTLATKKELMKILNGREIDFLIAVDDSPRLAVEVKTSEREISPWLSYFCGHYGMRGLQLVGNLRLEYEQDGIEVREAQKWLEGIGTRPESFRIQDT